MTTASTLGGQLRLDVHPADGALLVGDEPLVHAQLVEEVHTRETSGGGHRPDVSALPPCTPDGVNALVSALGANPRYIHCLDPTDWSPEVQVNTVTWRLETPRCDGSRRAGRPQFFIMWPNMLERGHISPPSDEEDINVRGGA